MSLTTMSKLGWLPIRWDRVVLSALNNLNLNETWNDNNFKIESVHLMGAAVDDEEVSSDPIEDFNNPGWGPSWRIPYYYTGDGVKSPYGNAIAEEVVSFYNLINPEDNVLQFIFHVSKQQTTHWEKMGNRSLEYYRRRILFI